MKKNILSFDQAVLVEDGVSAQEVVFLDWFLQFFGSPAMEYIQEEGVLYGKVRRAHVLEQLPILKLSCEKSVSRMIGDLCDKGYLRKIVRQSGNAEKTIYLAIGDRTYEATGIMRASETGDPMEDAMGQKCPMNHGTQESHDTSIYTSYNTHLYHGTQESHDHGTKMSYGGKENPSLYRKILEEWGKLGDKAVQPPNEIHFLNKAPGEIAPHIRGVHSSDVLQSIQNFGKTLEDPNSYWKAKISVYTFFQRHFEKFLPANYDPEMFLDSKASQRIREERAHKEMVRRIMESPL